jgi:hypothetical protein
MTAIFLLHRMSLKLPHREIVLQRKLGRYRGKADIEHARIPFSLVEATD